MLTLPPYILTMADFLQYLRERRAVLKKDLAALDVAERVYRDSQSQSVAGQQSLEIASPTPELSTEPKTIKQMVVRCLEASPVTGATSGQILEHIHALWMPELERASLAPQLSRLKQDGVVNNHLRMWTLITPEFEKPNETEAPADTETPDNSAGAT